MISKKRDLIEKKSVKHENTEIEFFLVRKKVKNINLRVKKDLSVVVSADYRVPTDFILDFIKSKAEWIIKNQKKIMKHYIKEDKKLQYISGEEIPLFGKRLILQVKKQKNELVQIDVENIRIFTRDPDNYLKKHKLIDKYYTDFLKKVILSSVKNYSTKIDLGFEPEIKIRKMVSRWGSCTVNKGRITFNFFLVHVPKTYIDYVVLHELLHFRYQGHNKEFYSALSRYMPKWKEYRRVLNENGDDLLNSEP